VRTDAKVCHVDLGERVVQAAPRGRLFENLRGTKNPIAVGDWVRVDLAGDPVSIDAVEERRNSLSRTASSHDPREQVLVANVDRLFVISSVGRPGFSSNRTDRILAACVWEEIPATLVINKSDLGRAGELDALRETYEKAGVEVLETCALDGTGVGELRGRLQGKTSVFYGASGAGKSSLLNALEPGLGLRVGKISKYWRSGRHTTTFSQLIQLPAEAPNTFVIDTPGIRVFRLYGVSTPHLRDLFPDFAPYQERCAYPNCQHDHEPDCAVIEAVENEEIAETRYASYLEILDELEPPPEDDTPVEPPEGGVS